MVVQHAARVSTGGAISALELLLLHDGTWRVMAVGHGRKLGLMQTNPAADAGDLIHQHSRIGLHGAWGCMGHN